jgi:hypothetical protein
MSDLENKKDINSANVPVQKEKKSKDGLYILVILILLIGAGYLGWEISKKNKALNQCEFNNTELNNEIGDMNEMLYEQGLAQGENLKQNLEMMLTDYEQMENLNTDLNDSIVAQKEKIKTILEELEKEKGNKRYYARKVRELTEETETLRAIMKDYVRTIDSLRTENLILQTDLENTKIDLTNVAQERDTYKSKTEDLSNKVNAGSKLTAAAILTEGIKQKSSGSYKVTSKASRATHIRSCFDITENRIATAGNKTIYMRIITPQGGVLHSSNSNVLSTEEGTSLLYSDKKTINYQNQPINVCIFYELSNGETLSKGNYIAELWCEGVRIGTNKFVLN